MARKPKTLAKKLIKAALDKKAENVLLFDLRSITTMADFFIICSGTSDTHVKAISDAILDACKKNEVPVYGTEGYESLSWVLIDLVDIVVHVFKPETREYYQLERLWGDAEIESFDYEGKEATR